MEEKKSFKEFLCTPKGKIVLTAVIYAIYFLIMALIGGSSISSSDSTFSSIFALIVFVIWIVFGWRGLSKIQPNVFLIMPIAGWIAYFIVKGILALIAGIFITPFQIAKLIIKHLEETL